MTKKQLAKYITGCLAGFIMGFLVDKFTVNGVVITNDFIGIGPYDPRNTVNKKKTEEKVNE